MNTAARNPQTLREGMRIFALVLLILLGACGGDEPAAPQAKPAPAPEGEWAKPYDGWLPDTAPENTAVVRVVDERTGRPIQGALVRRHLEMEMGPDGWGPSFEEALSDEYGIAVIHIVEERAWSSHWAVHANGYGSTETYGVAPNEEVELLPGRDVHGRIVDAMGRPAANLKIQYKLGCGHAPPMVETRTDRDGVFVLRGVAESGDVAYSGPGILVDYFDGPLRRLDETPHTHAAAPGMRIRGRIVGAEAKDLGPRIVHSQSTTRGVIARIADDGSFVLDGVARESMLDLYWAPDDKGRRINTDDFRVDVPIVWDVRRDYDAEDESSDEDLEIEWRVVDAEGAPVEPVEIHVYRTSDGREVDFEYVPEGDARDTLFLAPGRYDVIVGDPTARWVAPARRLVVEAGKPTPLVLQAREQPRLVLEWAGGEPPEDCTCTVAFAGADGRIDHEGPRLEADNDPEYGVHVPASAPARVAVRVGDVTRFYDVGPAAQGRRVARIDWPAPKTLRFEAPEDVHYVRLGDLSHDFAREGGAYVVRTQLEGRLRLEVFPKNWGGRTAQDAPVIDVPPAPGAVVTLPRQEYDGFALGQVTLQDATGAPIEHEEIDVRWFNPVTRELEYDEVHTNERGVAVSPFFRSGAYLDWRSDSRMDHGGVLEGSGPWTQRTGSCRLVVQVTGPDGELEDAVVLLDAETYRHDREHFDGEAPPGSFTFGEVPAGPHRLVVTAPGHRGEQRRLILKEGETRTVEVKLPKR